MNTENITDEPGKTLKQLAEETYIGAVEAENARIKGEVDKRFQQAKEHLLEAARQRKKTAWGGTFSADEFNFDVKTPKGKIELSPELAKA